MQAGTFHYFHQRWIQAIGDALAGEAAKFPDPGDDRSIAMIEELPVLSLPQLIQSKLACGMGDIRRTHQTSRMSSN